MTDPAPMKRRQIRKGELRVIAGRMFPKYDETTLDALSRDGLRNLIKRHGRCECGCGVRFDSQTPDYDHTIPNALLFDGDKIKWRALLKACHKKKSAGDIQAIAKTKRLRGITGQKKRRDARGGSSIQGRGFETPPPGYDAWGKDRRSNVKVID